MRYLIGTFGGMLIAIAGVMPIRTVASTLDRLPIREDLLVWVPAIVGGIVVVVSAIAAGRRIINPRASALLVVLGVLVAVGGALLTLVGNPAGSGGPATLAIGAAVLAAGVAVSAVYVVRESRSSRRFEMVDG